MQNYNVDPTKTVVVWDWVRRIEVELDPQAEAERLVQQLLEIEWPSDGMARSFVGAIVAHTRNRIAHLGERRRELGEQMLALTEADPERDKRWPKLAGLRSAQGSELWLNRMQQLAVRAESLNGELRLYELLHQMVRDEAAARGIEIASAVDAAPSRKSVEELKAWAFAQAGLTTK